MINRSILVAFLALSWASSAYSQTASWYSTESCKREGTSGVFTASGEPFNENALTCALPNRKFGSFYKVTNLANGKSVVVRHNDFGPSKKLVQQGRIIDLSKGAFSKIANLKEGLISVRVDSYQKERV